MLDRLVAASLTCVAALAQSTAPVQWTTGAGANGHWYQAVHVPTRLTWAEAERFALIAGGTLASINSVEENLFVFSLIDAPQFWYAEGGPGSGGVGTTNVGPWLGGYQVEGAGEPGSGWQWADCQCPFGFGAWLPGQPNNYTTPTFANEDRLHYCGTSSPTRTSMWNDIDGDQATAGYVVEWVAAPLLGQANSAQATLLANGIGATTTPGPYFQVIDQESAVTISWSGPPGAPFMLALGNAAPCTTTLGCYGCLDLVPLVILLDGSTPLGQLIFSLNGAGYSSQTFSLPPLPPGTELSFQGLVAQPDACGALLTAAHVLIVR